MTSALMPTYARADLAFERGEGPYLYTIEGQRFLDFAAGIAVNSLGHCHPRMVEALTRQAGKLWHVSNLYTIPEGQKLADKLAANSFAERAFFANSGAEAIEGALKIARKFQSVSGHPDKVRVICCTGAFHGRTLTTLSAAGNQKYLDGFGPASPGFDHVPYGNLNELRAAITPETGAILVEPIQGEGGVRPASLDYLRGLRQVADEYGLVLIFDEVQCGVGRTGKLFAHEWAGIAPDVMALAKGLGGGFPIGAILASAKISEPMVAGTHGSTFGGNPLAMTVAGAVLDVILEEGFLARVERVGNYLWDKLEQLVSRHPKIFGELRGAGLMLGLKCVAPNSEVVAALRKEGLLTVGAAENVVRILPPLIIEKAHVDEALAALERAAAKLEKATSAA